MHSDPPPHGRSSQAHHHADRDRIHCPPPPEGPPPLTFVGDDVDDLLDLHAHAANLSPAAFGPVDARGGTLRWTVMLVPSGCFATGTDSVSRPAAGSRSPCQPLATMT